MTDCHRRLAQRAAVVANVVLLTGVLRGAAGACVGLDCLQIRSSQPGGGVLVLQHDFARKVQTFQSFCTPGETQCLYTTIDPGFRAEPEEVPGLEHFRLVDGVRVRVEIVETDPPVSVSINGQKLHQPGQSAAVGTMPEIHSHPSWQLQVPGGEVGDYRISYKLTADTLYGESAIYTSVVTNIEPTPDSSTPTITPTPTPTSTPRPCPGDCDGDGAVSVDELIRAVNISLGSQSLATCESCDVDHSGVVTVDELVTAVNAALSGCPAPPTPEPATLATIQYKIFTANCLGSGCHNAGERPANLVLETGRSAEQLIDVTADNFAAAAAGLKRVDPGNPDNSFLLVKLTNPRPDYGSRMPLGRPALPAKDVALIREWILNGAPLE